MNKMKILVVDDEPDVVSVIGHALSGEGFEVLRAYDGISALDMVETERPDLVLLDIMMPMMSGYEVCEQLKANPTTQQIPVVCLSSAHNPSARAQILKVGAASYVEKPFLPAELVVQIRRLLNINEA
ncbi:MAG TPA: response regulator [Candidatus Hydrogenedentes bacterium]|nr:response regulator [Candidatus Hydrogenedentota bacterium]HPG66671.1 response regulator [Candidatus Hydrogenedentota bacterium]